MVIHNFIASNKVGLVGEQIVREYLESKHCTVTKVEKNLPYDFIVEGKDLFLYVEVKTDRKAEQTGNIFWETMVSNKPGWALKEVPHEVINDLLYIWVINDELIIMPRVYFDRISYKDYPIVEIKNNSSSGKILRAEGYKVPVSVIKEHSQVIKQVGI